MALIPCPECGTQVSDKAVSCPKCGHPLSLTQKSASEGPIQPAKTLTKQATPTGSPKRGFNPVKIIVGVLVLALLIIAGVVGVNYYHSKQEEKKQIEVQRQAEAQRAEALKVKQQAEEQRRIVEEELRKQEEAKRQEEAQRRAVAYKQIRVGDWKFKTNFGGGLTLQYITLTNPTTYSFNFVRYEFFDATDGITKITSSIGPLLANQSQTFNIDQRVEGLWEHKYGIRITGGTVVE